MAETVIFKPKEFNYKVLPRLLEKIGVLDDGDYEISLKKKSNKRSLNANSYFHVLVTEIAEKMNIGFEQCKVNLNLEYGTVATDENGKKIGFMLPQSVDVSKIYKYTRWFDEREINGTKFNCYIVYKETHTLDTKEMARLIDGTVQEAKQLGIETLPPDELARLMESEKQ